MRMKKLTAESFKNQEFFIGIDVHKKQWSVTIRNNGMYLKTFSTSPSAEHLSSYLTRNYPGGKYYSAYEAGFCGFHPHRELLERGIDNIVVNPGDIPTKNKDKVNKRDKVDSKKISRELASGSLDGIYVPDDWHLQLRSLVRLYSRCVSQSTRLKNRIKGFLYFNGVKFPDHSEMCHWSRGFISHLESLSKPDDHGPGIAYIRICIEELKAQRQQILEVLKILRHIIKQNSAAEKTVSLLKSIPGVGFLTAITLYSEIIDINRFPKFDHLCSFAGIVPGSRSTGETDVDTGLTHRRNRNMRYLLVESSWIAVRKDPALLLRFDELTKTKKKQDAIIRIAKKLLNRVRFVWKNQKPYVSSVIE